MKSCSNFKLSNTLFSVSFAVLCSRIGTKLTSKHPPPGKHLYFIVVAVFSDSRLESRKRLIKYIVMYPAQNANNYERDLFHVQLSVEHEKYFRISGPITQTRLYVIYCNISRL